MPILRFFGLIGASAALLLIFETVTISAFQQPLFVGCRHRPCSKTTTTQWSQFPPLPSSSSSWNKLQLDMSSSNANEIQQQQNEETNSGDPLVAQSANALGRLSWLSWWVQVILSVISSVIILFSRNVTRGISSNATRQGSSSFILAGSGIIISFLSILWTWGGARLAKRFVRQYASTSRLTAANLLRRAINVGVTLNLLGMATSLIGAEVIVGGLAAKAFTLQGSSSFVPGSNSFMATAQTIQPVEILVVQANTNALLSHFCSICSHLYLVRFLRKLDPPSTVDTKTSSSS